jgi:stage III sporulation protein AB
MVITKLTGALLLICACGAVGIGRSLQLKLRVRSLCALTDSLALMQNGICRLLTPLPELASRLALDAPEAARPLFRSLLSELPMLGERPFSELWAAAVENSRSNLLLRGEETETLCVLGLSLGGGAEEQEKALGSARVRLELCLTAARSEAETRCRLYTALGLSSGMLLSIILL